MYSIDVERTDDSYELGRAAAWVAKRVNDAEQELRTYF